jgi:transcriptional/translational regulatory protein YebC/TACO1
MRPGWRGGATSSELHWSSATLLLRSRGVLRRQAELGVHPSTGAREHNRAFPADAATELALETGGDDVLESGDEWSIYTATDQLFQVVAALREKAIQTTSQKFIYRPNSTTLLTDVDTAKAVIKLYDVLDDYDDTQNVHANFEIADEIADALS